MGYARQHYGKHTMETPQERELRLLHDVADVRAKHSVRAPRADREDKPHDKY